MSRGKVLVRPEWTTLPPASVTPGEWNETQGRAAIAASRVFDVREYGAVGDNVTDDTAALQQCADECRAALGTFYVPAWFNCKITGTLDLRYIRNIQIEGIIRVHHTSGIGVIIGNAANSTAPTSANIYAVIKQAGNTNADPMVRTIGVKNGDIRVLMTEYMQLWADAAISADASLAYSRFFLGKVDHLELNGVNGAAWINENYFYGGRVATLTVSGAYSHNHNKFECSFEHSTIVFNTGNNNQVRGRFEGSCTVTFASGTWLNRVIQTWVSNATVASFTPTVTDAGIRNRVMTVDEADGTWQTFWRIDANTQMTMNSIPVIGDGWGVRPGFRLVQTRAQWPYVYDSGRVPVDGLEEVTLRSDAALWRLYVQVFDSNGATLDGASTWYISNTGSGWAWDASAQEYSLTGNRSSWAVRVIRPEVAFIRIRVRLGGVGAGHWFEYVELTALQPGGSYGDGIAAATQNARAPLAQAGATPPPESLLPVGSTVSTDTGLLLVTHSADTTLTPGRAAGSTFITVDSLTGITTGDHIAIELQNGQTHFTTVSSVASGINLASALPSGAITGARVKTQRWKHITT